MFILLSVQSFIFEGAMLWNIDCHFLVNASCKCTDPADDLVNNLFHVAAHFLFELFCMSFICIELNIIRTREWSPSIFFPS